MLKSEKNISRIIKGTENRDSRRFESYKIGKMGVWHLRKNPLLFCPPDMQKTQEFPGFFGPASFLRDRNGGDGFFKSEQKAASISLREMVSVPFL